MTEGIDMVVSFARRGQGDYPAEDRTVLPRISARVLDRHGARVLDPTTAVAAPGFATPDRTVYRAASLLARTGLQPALDRVAQVLGEAGLQLGENTDQLVKRLGRATGEHCTVPLSVSQKATKPAVVDAWTALQTLRADPRTRGDADGFALEHLMFSSTVTGSPHEVSGLAGDRSYQRGPASSRIPVWLAAGPPSRRELDRTTFTRRPVIAVLDTGIGPHPWFDLPSRVAGGPPSGNFVSVLPQLQNDIRAAQLAAAGPGVPVIEDFWDTPQTDEPLVGEINSDAGHGTFIAGIIRQAAPDADVLAVRVLHSDGIGYEGDVLLALREISRRVDAAQAGETDQMVDIVSLSFGYFDESAPPDPNSAALAQVIAELTAKGVLVVAAAGNDATSRRFYPAAFSDELSGAPDRPQVLGVGALNPNSTPANQNRALFSNDGKWVNCWAIGAGMVSAYPTDISGSLTAQQAVPALRRSGLDPDDFTGGFAVWDGTSFATPLAAARLARLMIESDGAGLADVDQQTTLKRAIGVLDSAGQA